MSELDVREIPPNERHDRIHDVDDPEPGESLTIVNDHDPKPLYYELSAEVPAFDDEACAVEREGPERFVAELPKAATGSEPETVRIDDLNGEPHARAFPGSEPKTVRPSLSAGEDVAEHDHPDRTVLFHALEGSFDVALDGEDYRVETLGGDDVLIQYNDRTPQFLFPRLDDRGFAHAAVETDETDAVVTAVWPADGEAGVSTGDGGGSGGPDATDPASDSASNP
ncbi:DUF2249 domain-containing protein [Halorubrum sp. BOL3-1]|uniref:DUF2249 domain-containing protein n=1 Tax=Halorubrum sp. BOL3-1 TaxID=2497325 RepID=UPI001004F5CE|nr:DUF2249 domain-containing protein [Halorubrum sp. BOL3-1]